jgi:hypothetical protein
MRSDISASLCLLGGRLGKLAVQLLVEIESSRLWWQRKRVVKTKEAEKRGVRKEVQLCLCWVWAELAAGCC